MEQFILLKLSKEELIEIVNSAILESLSSNHQTSKTGKLIKINELCEVLKVSKATIHKWKKEGRIPFRRMSNRVFFYLDEVLDSLDRIDLKR